MPSLSLWVVLLIAAVVPRANRKTGVLLIIAPAVVVYGGWLAILTWVLPPVAAQDESLSAFILALAIGSALLWLVGHVLAGGTWRRTLIGALSVTTGVAILTALSFRFEVSAYTISMMGGQSIPMLALVVGYAMAGRHCRGLHHGARFALWLATWMVVPAVAAFLVFTVLQSAFLGSWPTSIVTLLGFAALAGLVVGVITFLISLLFLLVGLRSPLLRERLFACLRLLPEPGPASAVAAADPRQGG